jgi:hypothetical protein
MGDGARLILLERYLADDPREELLVLHADLEILVNVGGRERTTDEYAPCWRAAVFDSPEPSLDSKPIADATRPSFVECSQHSEALPIL